MVGGNLFGPARAVGAPRVWVRALEGRQKAGRGNHMADQQSQAGQLPSVTIQALQQWTRAKEAAGRHNRNLLQFGASFGAALGIEAGSWGLVAVAEGLAADNTPLWLFGLLFLIMAFAAGIAIVMAILLLQAYKGREEAEKAAEVHLEALIELVPDNFLPRGGVGPEAS